MSDNIFFKTFAQDLSPLTGIPVDELMHLIEIPQQAAWGDLSFPCFRLAKQRQKDPQQIAAEISQQLAAGGMYASATAVKAYVNVGLNRSAVVPQVLAAIRQDHDRYGTADSGQGQRIVIDFSSPNIVKPFHMGHLRTTMIGQSLANLYEALGYKVTRLNYLGDWGTQFGKLITAFKLWGDRAAIEQAPISRLNDLYVRFNTELEKDENAQNQARQWFKKLEDEDPEARELWQWFKDISRVEFDRIYKRLNIRFDEFSGESFYIKKVTELVRGLLKTGIAKESQGAIIVDLEPYQLGVCILRKADGASIYAARDVCAALDRYERYKFAQMIYVTDAGQSLHFKQVFKILELMGQNFHTRCTHVPYGLVNLREGKMSTRQGTFVYLEEVLNRSAELVGAVIREKNPDLPDKQLVAEQVGVGAAVFADLSSRTRKDILFDWNEVLNFNGETGPYVQYTYARLCSILRKYQRPVPDHVDFSLLLDDSAYNLVKQLMVFPEKVKNAAAAYEPSFITGYVIDVCAAVNNFYNQTRVLSDDTAVTEARVLLIYDTGLVIKKCLTLLGISAPEEM